MNILAIVKITISAVPSVFKRPGLVVKLLGFAAAKNEKLLGVKKATSKDEKIALSVALAKDIVEFKKQSPDDFDGLCELISELANIYEGDEGVRKSISALM